jgi:DeoR/GlpR family transcriptional regulator of sugar metabolism
MKPEQRQPQIMAQLRALQGELSVDELAHKFQVSPLTIRRDLEQLEKDGAILRTHGGCVLRAAMESAYQQRVAQNFELKQAIGTAAAKQVKPGDAILINDGSTAFHVAANLRGIDRLLVYTNSIPVIAELSRHPNIRLYILGGEYNPELHFLGGSLMEQVLESLHFDLVFLGTDAIDPNGECSVLDPDVCRLTEIMLRRGSRRILLADHTKVGATAHAIYARLSDFDVWFTTPGLSPQQLRRYGQQTVVEVAEP